MSEARRSISVQWIIDNHNHEPRVRGVDEEPLPDVERATPTRIRIAAIGQKHSVLLEEQKRRFGHVAISVDQERYLIKAYQGGSQVAANGLLSAHEPYLRRVVSTHRCRVDPSDLLQTAKAALLKAALAFDPSFDVRLLTYATHEILAAVRREKRLMKTVVHIPREAPKDERDAVQEVPFDDWMRQIAKYPTESQLVDAIDVRQEIRVTRQRRAEVLNFLIRGYNREEIAEELGISRQRVEQLERDGWWPYVRAEAVSAIPKYLTSEVFQPCRVCGISKTLSEFYFRSGSASGKHETRCKQCSKNRALAAYHKGKSERLAGDSHA